MIHDPEVLILDEPTNGLDPNQIVEIRNLIRQLGRAKTVVLSTHILSEVQATCDRVVIIHHGKIAADGTLDQLQEKFHGSETICLEIKAAVANPMIDIYPKLHAISSVESVAYTGQNGDLHRFSVQTQKGIDIREEIFRQAIHEKWVLLEMTRTTTSLEEVFHSLTTPEAP
jgi:ABC-2 type transport system ATP-binding protein